MQLFPSPNFQLSHASLSLTMKNIHFNNVHEEQLIMKTEHEIESDSQQFGLRPATTPVLRSKLEHSLEIGWECIFKTLVYYTRNQVFLQQFFRLNISYLAWSQHHKCTCLPNYNLRLWYPLVKHADHISAAGESVVLCWSLCISHSTTSINVGS